eukprot:1394822-Amorphochlora_amoeboformis.AAC.1
MITLLLVSGARPDLHNAFETTPMDLAMVFGVEALPVLLNHNLDNDNPNPNPKPNFNPNSNPNPSCCACGVFRYILE